MTEQAISYWHHAGELAAQHSAVTEAAVHFNQALELLRTCPKTVERLTRELDFLTKLGSVLMSAKGPARDEVARVYTDARDLCRSLGETSHLVPVLQGLRLNHPWPSCGRLARLQKSCLALGEQVQDAGYLLEGNLAVGILLDFYQPEEFLIRPRALREGGITFYQTAQHRSHALRRTIRPGPKLPELYSEDTLGAFFFFFFFAATRDRRLSVARKRSTSLTTLLTPRRSSRRWPFGRILHRCGGNSGMPKTGLRRHWILQLSMG